MTRYVRYALFLVALTALAAGCGGSSNRAAARRRPPPRATRTTRRWSAPARTTTALPPRAALTRSAGRPSFGFTNNFDPTGEYLGDAWGIYSNLMLRSLIGYNHVPGAAGNVLVPDLATTVPKPTNGGKTYTFTIRKGVKFARRSTARSRPRTSRSRCSGSPTRRTAASTPSTTPSSRAGTTTRTARRRRSPASRRRTTRRSCSSSRSRPVTSLRACRCRRRRRFRRRSASASRASRAATAATSSRPARTCSGARQRRRSSCSSLKPMSGYDGQRSHIILVRNPNYDQSTDQVPRRTTRTSSSSSSTRTPTTSSTRSRSGDSDDERVEPAAEDDPRVRDGSVDSSRGFPNVGDRTWYLTMNLTQPPFDDIHVRKAMNWIMDKAALLQAWGGPIPGTIANHIVPTGSLGNQLAEYEPYETPDDDGQRRKAQAAMKGSKYDTEKNGTCTRLRLQERAPDRRHPRRRHEDGPGDPGRARRRSASPSRSARSRVPTRRSRPRRRTSRSPSARAGVRTTPTRSPSSARCSTAGTIIPNGNTNYSLVGITPAQCKTVKVDGQLQQRPERQRGHRQLRATSSAAAHSPATQSLDKKLMTKVVPWVPYLWSNT